MRWLEAEEKKDGEGARTIWGWRFNLVGHTSEKAPEYEIADYIWYNNEHTLLNTVEHQRAETRGAVDLEEGELLVLPRYYMDLVLRNSHELKKVGPFGNEAVAPESVTWLWRSRVKYQKARYKEILGAAYAGKKVKEVPRGCVRLGDDIPSGSYQRVNQVDLSEACQNLLCDTTVAEIQELLSNYFRVGQAEVRIQKKLYKEDGSIYAFKKARSSDTLQEIAGTAPRFGARTGLYQPLQRGKVKANRKKGSVKKKIPMDMLELYVDVLRDMFPCDIRRDAMPTKVQVYSAQSLTVNTFYEDIFEGLGLNDQYLVADKLDKRTETTDAGVYNYSLPLPKHWSVPEYRRATEKRDERGRVV